MGYPKQYSLSGICLNASWLSDTNENLAGLHVYVTPHFGLFELRLVRGLVPFSALLNDFR